MLFRGQSLVKDFNETSHEILQANALRVLSRIVDGTMLSGLDRYYREAIVDSSAMVASAGLTSGLHMLKSPSMTESVKRWVGEIQSRVTASGLMPRFHALCLLYALKQTDSLGISRLVSSLIAKNDLTAPLATTVLIRFTGALLRRDLGAIDPRAAYAFLEGCTRHPSDVVRHEAARAICALPGVVGSDIRPAVSVLAEYLTSKSPAARFAAVRALSQIAQLYPDEVAVCNSELETLVGDNRNIATYALTALLKTCTRDASERLLKHILAIVGDISDEFRVIIARAVHDLALRFPEESAHILRFVSSALREEGGFEFKRVLVDIAVDMMERFPARCKVEALFHLCEFIEDCEFTTLCTRVLHLLGDVGPTIPQPALLIRFVYNRLLLENAPVRAAAVSALAKFGARVPALRPSVITLLHRVKHDDDDEVRDRITNFLDTLQRLDEPAAGASAGVAEAVTRSITGGTLPMHVSALQKALRLYQLHPTTGAFSFDHLPAVDGAVLGEVHYGDVARAAALAEAATRADGGRTGAPGAGHSSSGSSGSAASSAAAGSDGAAGGGAGRSRDDAGVEELYAIKEMSDVGPLFRTTTSTKLTEDELEYLVSYRKHIFAKHVVFEFRVTNTVEHIQLERVTVDMTPLGSDAAAWVPTTVMAAPVAKHGAPVRTYVCMRRADADRFPATSFECLLRFSPVEVDPATGAVQGSATYEEDFAIDEVRINAADFVMPRAVPEFRTAWESVPEEQEVQGKFSHPYGNVPEAASALIKVFNMAPCNDSAAVPSGSQKAQVLLAGVFLGGQKVLVRLRLMDHPQHGVVSHIAVRAERTVEAAKVVLSLVSV